MDEKLLKKLCLCSGVSGDEQRVREMIIKQISPYCESIETDSIGNLYAVKKGEKTPASKIMLCAHMDEVGIMIKKIDAGGFLKFVSVGGIDPRVLLAKRVYIGESAIPGVIGVKAIHIQDKQEKDKAVPLDKLYIDIGATSYMDAAKRVNCGDYGSFEPRFEKFGDGLVCAKALDDRAGCAILCELIKGRVEYDTTFVFTVQEEVGLRGATLAAKKVRPDFCLVLESTTSADFLAGQPSAAVTHVGQGVALSVADGRTIYDKTLVNDALKLAKNKKISCQIKRSTSGGNDSGAIQQSCAGSGVLALSIPCRYLHTQSGVIAKSDYQSAFDLALCLIKEFGGK